MFEQVLSLFSHEYRESPIEDTSSDNIEEENSPEIKKRKKYKKMASYIVFYNYLPLINYFIGLSMAS